MTQPSQTRAPRPTGAHRRQTTSHTKRVVSVAATIGAVSAAGVASSAAAGSHSPVTLAADQVDTPQNQPRPITFAEVEKAIADSPQILRLPSQQQIVDLNAQIQKAVAFNQARIEADQASRMPSVVKPTEGVLTTGYQMRWGQFHKGVDIANALGTPERAVVDATVIDAGPASGFGQWVRLRDDEGNIFVYGHMETIFVSVGQRVKAGQVIAAMGSRGFSTGSHLHFEVHPNGSGAVDPIPWLAERGIQL